MDKMEKNRRINCKRNNQSHRAKIRKIKTDPNIISIRKNVLIEDHERNLKY
jgi:hypothetical protein